MSAFDHEYPPGDWTARTIERALRDAPETYAIPTYGEVDRWAGLRNGEPTGQLVAEILADADAHRGEPVPALPATDILAWARDGDRRYQRPSKARINRLSTFALAECFDRRGRFLDDVLDYAWALCEQAGWSYPTNFADAELVDGLPVEVPPADRSIEIRKCEIALLLAEVDHVLGDRLHGALRERIRTETERRLFRTYEASEDFHWFGRPAYNKNAVCNGRTLLAAMYLVDDMERLARLLEKGIHNLERYLAGFDPDGCTAEGIGYWRFGFKFYVWLAAQLEARTAGELSLLSPPIVDEIARFPMRIELSPGRYPPFSDTPRGVALGPSATGWLGDRLEIPWLTARAFADFGGRPIHSGLPTEVRDLLWCPSRPPTVDRTPDPRRYFRGHQWWLARATPGNPGSMVVAAKGGHNGEPHNHNDCGSFVVDVDEELLLGELGAPGYEQYRDGRYEALPARSLGHSVPYVNGVEQSPGAGYAAEVIDRVETTDREAITFDLGGCYPAEAGVSTLERSIALEREGPRVVVEDRGRFGPDAPGTDLVAVLVSFHPMTVSEGALRVTGDDASLTVRIDGDVARDPIAVERLADAFRERTWGGPAEYTDVWRATIDTDGARTPRLSLHVEPDVD